jgi:hypothetical protein
LRLRLLPYALQSWTVSCVGGVPWQHRPAPEADCGPAAVHRPRCVPFLCAGGVRGGACAVNLSLCCVYFAGTRYGRRIAGDHMPSGAVWLSVEWRRLVSTGFRVRKCVHCVCCWACVVQGVKTLRAKLLEITPASCAPLPPFALHAILSVVTGHEVCWRYDVHVLVVPERRLPCPPAPFWCVRGNTLRLSVYWRV